MTVPRAQNVLISAATTAHLADFESVREERTGASRTYSRSASRSGSAVATRKYEAPEMRAGTVPKATAASDMYSYGVCALLACCDGSGVVFDAETEALRSWDREHAHAKGGPHLPSLLDELLDLDRPPATSAADAVGRRISAREALGRPFLDPAAEREQARLETEAVARKQREAEWEEAERRRAWAEAEAERERALRSARLEAAACKAEIEGRERQLESQHMALLQQEVAANSAVEAATRAEAKEEAARQAAKEEAAKQMALVAAEKKKRAVEEAKAKAAIDKKKAELQEQQQKIESMASKHTDALWLQLAQGIDTDAAVRAFFDRRQPAISHAGRPRKIKEAIKVVNQARLKAFQHSAGFSLNTTTARQQHWDTLLFHGCPPDAATNIQAEGLLLKYGGKNGSMLGAGLYGAPDPRKSVTYCRGSQLGDFIFVCRFNLSRAKHAGPQTHHRNSVFEEFCVPKESHAVVLWMLKLA